jgi:phage terminase small subunit
MITALASGRMSPLEYMLSVMNDPDADPARRDRMAVAAAPYVHIRGADAKLGKKEAAEQVALTTERETTWEVLLEPPFPLGRD